MKKWWKNTSLWLGVGVVILAILLIWGFVEMTTSGTPGLIAGIVILTVIFTGVFVAAEKFAVPWIIVWLGNQDHWWSPYRTLPPPGEMYLLVKGDPDGPFDSLLESVLDFHYDKRTHEFIDLKGNPDPDKARKDFLSNLGVAKVGFWKYFLYREVRYDKWEKKPGSADWGLVEKIRGKRNGSGESASPSIFFQYNMATEVKSAETEGNFPVDAIIVFTVQIINPQKAFFFAGGWEVQATAAIQAAFREYVATKDIDDLRKEISKDIRNLDGSITSTESPLVTRLKEANEGMNGLYPQFGVKIINAQFVKFDPVGSAEMKRAIEIREIKKQEALGEINTAKGRRRAMEIEAEGKKQARITEAAGIEADYAARSSVEGWQTLEVADALRKTNLTAIGGDILTAITPLPKEKK